MVSITTISTKLRVTSVAILSIFSLTLTFPVASVYANELATTPSTNQDKTVSPTEITSALRADDGLLASSGTTKTTTDIDSALQATTAGSTVDVPKDASDGVTLDPAGSDTPAIDVALPNADTAKDAKIIAPGTVAYAGNNGSANAVQATEDGGVRMLTIIDNPSAPTTYDYKVTVPGGGHVEVTEDGGAVVYAHNGEVISAIDQPWAKDANDMPVNTHFTTDGQTLTQHIEHNVPGVVYPVTADPFWDPIAKILRKAFNGVLGCVGGREAVHKGVRYIVSKGGTWLVLSRFGMKFVPVLGWVSCGYGAWTGIRY